MSDTDRRPGEAEPREPGGRHGRWYTIAGIVVLALILFFLVRHCSGGESSDAGEAAAVVSVQVARAERGTIEDQITAVGTLVPLREATINPKIAAPIARMGLLKNRYVRQGDVIATLESRDLRAQRAEAAAALQEATLAVGSTTRSAIPMTNAQDQKALNDARANADNARLTYDRRKVLYAQGGISKKDLEASLLALTQAEDDLRLAERSTSVHRDASNPLDTATAEAKRTEAANHLTSLDAQLSYSIIRAPFSGVITEQFQYQGEYANPGQKLVSIADTSEMIVKIPIADETATEIKVGDPAAVYPDDVPGRQMTGRITLVGRGADPQSRTVEVWMVLPNPNALLRPNSSARVVLSVR